MRFSKGTGVDTHLIRTCPVQTGHAFIQVASSGQNSIIVYGGSNKQITVDYISEAFCDFGKDDMLLLQNEISCTEEAIKIAADKGMRIAFNPSPFTQEILSMPLEKLDWLILNSTEGAICFDGETRYFQECYKVKAVDTTGAGDTFTGYFLACIAKGKGIQEALKIAGAAAAISVMSEGAAVSIPTQKAVDDFISTCLHY